MTPAGYLLEAICEAALIVAVIVIVLFIAHGVLGIPT